MTVSTTDRKQNFAGGQSALTFTFRALVDHPEYIQVKETLISTGEETDLTYLTHYTVTINTNGIGGVVHVSPTFSTAYTQTVYRVTTAVQESDYDDFNQFPADTLEEDLDRDTLILQENQEEVSRVIQYPITYTGSTINLPSPSADTYLGWNSGGTALENKTLPDPSTLVKATNSEAQGGTNDVGYMTPAKVKVEVEWAGAVSIPVDNLNFTGISTATITIATITNLTSSTAKITTLNTTTANLTTASIATITASTATITTITSSSALVTTFSTTTVKIANPTTGSIFYEDSNGVLQRIVPSPTAGTALMSNGVGVAPSYGTVSSLYGHKFIQAGTFSSVTATTITQQITSGDTYYIVIDAAMASVTPMLRVNSSTTSQSTSLWGFGHNGTSFATTSRATIGINHIALVGTASPFAAYGNANGGNMILEMKISGRNNDTTIAYVSTFNDTNPDGSSTQCCEIRGSAQFTNGTMGTLTFLQSGTSASLSGTYYVYKLRASSTE